MSLIYASTELKNDFKIIKKAIKNNGRVLQYLPEKFKNNFEIVLLSIKSNGWNIRFASHKLQSNFELLFESIRYMDNRFLHLFDILSYKNKYFLSCNLKKIQNYLVCYFNQNNINFSFENFDIIFIYNNKK
jgi:hypothetical protein